MIRVNFHNVGRNKRSWSKDYLQFDETALAKEARANGGLMSSEVDVELNDTISAGTVLVGGWRAVGTVTIDYLK